MLKQGVSIPGVTLLYLFATLPQHNFFYAEKDRQEKDLYYFFQDSMVGGPSIIFHRYHEKCKTRTHKVEMTGVGWTPKPCQRPLSVDYHARDAHWT